jgi:hypothetical protein
MLGVTCRSDHVALVAYAENVWCKATVLELKAGKALIHYNGW